MRRRISAVLLGTVTLAVAAAFAAPVASAQEQEPVGGCPTGDGWQLAPLGFVIDDLDNGNFADQNGDGWACLRGNRGQTVKHGIASVTWKDNTNPLPEEV
jgi:hypothetical protein